MGRTGQFVEVIKIATNRSIVAVVFMTSCVTSVKQLEPFSMPVVIQPLFKACFPVDFDSQMTLTEGSVKIFSATLVGNIPNNQKIALQFNTPLGDTVFAASRSLMRELPSWTISGRHDMTVTESKSEMIKVNGRELPFLSSELGCVLNGVWPNTWMTHLSVANDESGVFMLSGEDTDRQIDMSVHWQASLQSNQPIDLRSCAVLKWGGFLGMFKHAVTVCRDLAKEGIRMKVTGVSDYTLDWIVHNES